MEIAREGCVTSRIPSKLNRVLSSLAIGSTGAIHLLFLFTRKSEQLNGAQFGDQAEGDVIEKKKETAAHLESLPFSGKNLLNFRETP